MKPQRRRTKKWLQNLDILPPGFENTELRPSVFVEKGNCTFFVESVFPTCIVLAAQLFELSY